MKTLYIMVGVGFSGKSTLSKRIAEYKDAVLVSQDGIWLEKEKELNLIEDSDKDWHMILNIAKQRIRDELAKDNSVVFDHVNLRHSHREVMGSIAKEFGARLIVVYLDTPLDIQKERQSKNKEIKERHDVKQEYLDEAIEELEIPQESENVFIFKPEANIESWLSKLP